MAFRKEKKFFYDTNTLSLVQIFNSNILKKKNISTPKTDHIIQMHKSLIVQTKEIKLTLPPSFIPRTGTKEDV